VRLLQYVGNKRFLLALGADAVLHKFGSVEGGGLRQDRKAKLAIKGDGSNLMCVWAGAGLIAAANNESLVRVWHVEQDTHYVLQLNDVRHMAAPKDAIRTLAFNPRSRVLVGGTAMGRVCFWHFIGSQVSADVSSTKKVVEPSETDWDVLSPVSVSSSAIESLDFGVGESGLVCTRTAGTVSILNETVLHCRQSGGNAAIQLTAEKLIIQTSDGKTKKLNSAIRIKGVSIAGKNIMVWSGKKAEVHELVDGNVSPISAFFTKAVACALHKEDIFLAVGQRVEMCSLQGVVKKVLSFADTEGQPVSIDVWGDCLAVVSNTSHVKLWDISRREPKQLLPGRSFESVLGPGGSIRSVRVNSKGTKLSFVCSRADTDTGMVSPSSHIQVYDVETDTLASYNFGPEYFPVSHFWDPTEPKLLAVQTRRYELAAVDSADSSALHVADSGSSSASAAAASLFAAQSDARTSAFGASEDQTSSNVASDDEIRRAEGEVNMLFATGDNGVKLQDSFTLPPGDTLMGLDVPNLIFMSRPVDEARGSISIPKVKLRQMRDFVGLNVAILDEDTKADLINFSYNLCIGNMDEAFRSVKKIAGNSGIWENMAHMCVKTQRLDVAEVCLGNMGNAKGAAAVRKAKEEPEPAVAVAQLAIQLGLLTDAEQLYLQCGRYDLLVMLYAAWGRWPAALALAEKHDRIHLKSVCYQYACALEQTGDIKNAIKFYERAGTHRTDVPRMMLAAGRGADLDKYVQTADDAELSKWLAAYAESRQQYETAIQVYTTGKDWVSVVRVLCFQQNYARAAEVCIESEDAPACFHLARQYEMQDKIKEAMQFFQRARRYNHAVRLAKQHRMYTELLTMALESNNRLVQLDAAYHLEQIGMPDKAVLLYQKGGQLGRALELCFRSELFDSIRIIADELGADTDPAVLSQCGAFFLQRGQYDKAVHLLVIGNEFERALDICTQYQAKLSEEDADRMTAEKLPPTATEEQKEQRNSMLRRIAKIAKDQGNFVLACKKYTSAGDKVRAIKCLLKNGDTEKVIYYATYAKKPEIYMLAAAYLQNVDWHNDPEIMKAIIKFYTAAGAMLELATFYEACAQVEVDDFRDYEKVS
jgi:intraflagellar transport protein 140